MDKLKCSICGSEIEIPEEQKTFVCDNCGTMYDNTDPYEDYQKPEAEKPKVEKPKVEKPAAESKLESQDRSACDYLLKIILRELSASSDNKLSLRKSASTYSWKTSGDEKLAKKLDIVIRKSAECKRYITDKLTEVGYTNIKLKIESSTSKCSTEKDWQTYNKKLEEYYSHSTAYQKYFNAPDNEQSGTTTYYTFEVDCRTDNKSLLRKAKKKYKTFSDFYLSIENYIYIAIKVIVVVAIVVGLIFFVGRPVYKFIMGASDVVNSAFGLDDDEDETTKSESEEIDYYYVMADDCDAINIRQHASKTSKVITVVRSRSMKLIPTGERTDEWIQVKVDGWRGWVFHDIVKKVEQ